MIRLMGKVMRGSVRAPLFLFPCVGPAADGEVLGTPFPQNSECERFGQKFCTSLSPLRCVRTRLMDGRG